MSATTTDEDTLATVALLLGVAGLLPVLPLGGSIAAIVTGRIAGHRRDSGRARAAVALGWLGVLLPALALFTYCVVLGYPFPIHRYRPD